MCEEMVEDEHWNSPVTDQTLSMVPVASALAKGTCTSRPHIVTVQDSLSKLLKRSLTRRGPTLETVMS